MVGASERSVAGDQLLATKLYIPQWRPGLVARPRLIERLDEGARRKLALVSAPPGFGKTTLLAEWLAGTAGRGIAWVSLDPGDNDPALFWSYVVTAVQRVRAGVGANALALLRSPQPPLIESILTTVINEIAATDGNLTLALDDLHVIDAPSIHGAIDFLIDHLPPQMHLVIASRSDPPLPLARLRSLGDLTELRAADLRFTPEEAATFLNDVMGLDLAAADVAALETRTEGWIAGLQLAALSMRGRADVAGFISSFAGDDRYIVDYLVEEVLQRQPEDVRGFLLQTAILDRLSGGLCDAVTGRRDGRQMLETLERGNLFLIPLDDHRRWYRYHHLFADVLRAHAVDEHPERMPDLHRRAAVWFEGNDMVSEAIDHAIAAGDHGAVARLLVANVDAIERAGHFASVARWSASLPDELIRKQPRLALIRAASAMRIEPNLDAARRYLSWSEDAIAAIERCEDADRSTVTNGTDLGIQGIDAFKGEMLALKLQVTRNLPAEETTSIANRALELLPLEKHNLRGMLYLIKSGVQSETSELESALPSLEQGTEEARRANDPFLLSCMLEHRGHIRVAMGELVDGRRLLEEAIAAGRGISAEAAWATCSQHSSLAEVLLEHNDLERALEHVERFKELAAQSPKRSFILYGRATAAHVYLATRNRTAAFEQLREAESFAKGIEHFRYASFLTTALLKFHCQDGALDAAARVAQERGLSPDIGVSLENEEELTAYARYLVATGDVAGAVTVLSRLLPVVRESGRVQHEVHALALEAMTREQAGERGSALKSLGRATMLGEPGHFNRTFTGEGPVMDGLLTALVDADRTGRDPAEAGSL